MSDGSPIVQRIDSVLRTVPDLATAQRFYRAAMDFVPDGTVTEAQPDDLALLDLSEGRLQRLTMRLGAQTIQFLTFEPPGEPFPSGSTSSDLWFQHCAIVVSDIERAFRRVMAAGATPITEGGPQHLPANTGGVAAFKFRDPFGHPLELLAFPEGVGDPIWHSAGAALFRGIDHTAMAVSSSVQSRHFYETVMGLKVTDRSRNRGPEQTRLDAVPDDRVDVTALKPATSPPHLELLGYRTGTRRPLGRHGPADMAISRTLASGDLEAIQRGLSQSGIDPATILRGSWFGRVAIAFDDPDGHGWICQAADARFG